MPSKNKSQSSKLKGLVQEAQKKAPKKPKRLVSVALPDQDQTLITRSVKLTPGADGALLQIAADAATQIGRRTVGASAVVRALLRYVEEQNLTGDIVGLVRDDIASGNVFWGRVRK